MKESIGAATLFNIVILFILLFTAIMTITINRSRAFAVKENIINIIEEDNGVNITKDVLTEDIVNVMADNSYRALGTCPEGYVGYDRIGDRNTNPGESTICIKETSQSEEISNNLKGCYYSIMVFYRLDIPIFKEVFTFDVTGETKLVHGTCSK